MGQISDQRYQQAVFLGAGWNRWPLYWDRVERSPGQYDWAAYDQLVTGDIRHGLRSNAILLGRPGFHQNGGGINGLHSPVFSDGNDQPGPGKTINPANEWAELCLSHCRALPARRHIINPGQLAARRRPSACGKRGTSRISRCSGPAA